MNKSINQFQIHSQLPLGPPFTSFQNSPPKNLVLSLTDSCNLSCKYCFSHASPRSSTFEIADQAAKWLITSNPDSQEPVSINFFGGEPLLKFEEIIKPLVEKYSSQILFGITTNGTLLTEDIVDFLTEHSISVLLSIDGDAPTQNSQRSDSFAALMMNVPYLLLKQPSTLFRATLTAASIPHLYHNFKFAEKLGFRQATFIMNADETYPSTSQSELAAQFDRIAIELCYQLRDQKMPSIQFLPFINGLKQCADAFELNLNNTLHHCGFGTTSIGVDVLGNLHPCQECNSTSDFIIGDIYSGIDAAAHHAFLSSYLSSYNTFLSSYLSSCSCLPKELFVLNNLCPKRLYDDDQYSVPESVNIYTEAIFLVLERLYTLYYNSPNPLAQAYFNQGV